MKDRAAPLPTRSYCFCVSCTQTVPTALNAQISRHPGDAPERDVRMEQLVWRVWALKRRHAGVKAANEKRQEVGGERTARKDLPCCALPCRLQLVLTFRCFWCVRIPAHACLLTANCTQGASARVLAHSQALTCCSLALNSAQEQGGVAPPPVLTEQEQDATTLMTIDDLNAMETEALEAQRKSTPKPMDAVQEEVRQETHCAREFVLSSMLSG